MLIFLPAIISWFTVKLAHSGFALRAAPKAAFGKNAWLLGSTTVAESLVRTYISFVYNCAVTNSQALLPRGNVDNALPHRDMLKGVFEVNY